MVKTISLSSNTSDKQSATSKFGCPDSENSFFTIYDDPLEEVISVKLGVSRYDNTGVWQWLNKEGHPGASEWELFDLFIFLNENTSEQDVVSPEAIEFGLLAIDAVMDNGNLDFEKLVELINGMDKDCQALILFKSILTVDSIFTNLIKNSYLALNKPNIAFLDIAVGDGEPPLISSEGARTQPYLGINAETGESTIIIEFNNDYLDQATDLGLINTLYYELLHAHILNLYNQGQLLTVYPGYTDLNTALVNYYSDDTNSVFGEAYKQEMHNIYVDFIDVLAESLLGYATAYNISGLNLDYAKKLVWGGLKGNQVFTNNLTTAQQNEAQTLLAKENFNHSDAKSGKTCN